MSTHNPLHSYDPLAVSEFISSLSNFQSALDEFFTDREHKISSLSKYLELQIYESKHQARVLKEYKEEAKFVRGKRAQCNGLLKKDKAELQNQVHSLQDAVRQRNSSIAQNDKIISKLRAGYELTEESGIEMEKMKTFVTTLEESLETPEAEREKFQTQRTSLKVKWRVFKEDLDAELGENLQTPKVTKQPPGQLSSTTQGYGGVTGSRHFTNTFVSATISLLGQKSNQSCAEIKFHFEFLLPKLEIPGSSRGISTAVWSMTDIDNFCNALK